MRLFFSLFTLLVPSVLTAKEVPGEELPSNEASSMLKGDQNNLSDQFVTDSQSDVVKRSISDIAARRRSALDKSFMRFGRSDPEMTEPRVKLGGGNLMRFGRSSHNGFLRLGRGHPQDFMRFGRSPGNMMRFGRAANLMRFGRGGNNMMRFGRGGNNMMRFGRGGNNNMMRFGRGGNNMMRFGRGGNNMMRFGRGGNNNMMRFGRSDVDFLNYDNEPDFEVGEEFENELELSPTTTSNDYVRAERSTEVEKKPKSSKYANQRSDNLMRLGRSLLEKNYYDNEDENQEQFLGSQISNENNRIAALEKNKMYLDDGFLNLARADSSGDEPDALEIIFPEETRKKRSLIKNDSTDKPTPETSVDASSDQNKRPDVVKECFS